jgi:diguanylate cyclase (GGDEF)-like protein
MSGGTTLDSIEICGPADAVVIAPSRGADQPGHDREANLLAQVAALGNDLAEARRMIAQRNAELARAREQLDEQFAQLADAHLRLGQLAATDELTGVGNHRALQERLAVELAIARRQAAPLSLLLIDIDHFKRLNDTQGHPTGDEVLRSFGSLLRDRARAGDFVARYGGEEFAILCPGSDQRQSHTLAERLRRAIEEAPWSLGQVTASFGVATTDCDVDTRTELLGAADNALYQSKLDGRNRVTHACQMRATVGAV